MTPFSTITSLVAWLPEPNLDTDIIFPARFLLHTEKDGLGQFAFYDRRIAENLAAKIPFVLDQAKFKTAKIILAGDNFGCGSSREQAPWALVDLGIRCIIAPSFGEIFFLNCLQNSILPIVLSDVEINMLLPAVRNEWPVTVDLEHQVIRVDQGTEFTFAITPERRRALLSGRDEIATILEDFTPAIRAFEEAHRSKMPWLFQSSSHH